MYLYREYRPGVLFRRNIKFERGWMLVLTIHGLGLSWEMDSLWFSEGGLCENAAEREEG